MSRRVAICCLCGLAAARCLGQELDSGDAPNAVLAQSALLRVVEQASAPARVAGVLASIAVQEGDIVEEGALLAKIDDTEARLVSLRAEIDYELSAHRAANDVAIRSAEKGLRFAQDEFLRFQRAALKLPGSISKSELAQSEVASEQAALELEQARRDHGLDSLTEKLKRTERDVALRNQEVHQILSPLNGMVVEVLRRRGEWVEPGEDVVRVMRIDRLRAEGLVAVQHVMQGIMQAEAKVSVSLTGAPEVVAMGRVVFVHPEINPVDGNVRVRVDFDNPGMRLMPGMRAELAIFPQRVSAERHPSDAAKSNDSVSP